MVAPSLVALCIRAGWNEYGGILVEATEKLCLHGSTDVAVALVEKIAAPSSSTSEQSSICARMASIACEKILASSSKSTTLDTYKKLVRIIGTYCPSFAQRFTASAKLLDVDSIIYPLVTDNALKAAASNSMKDSLSVLAIFSAQKLSSRVSNALGDTTIWSIPNANLSQNITYSSFLRSPCKIVLDWKVCKSDHESFFRDLRQLISMGVISAESYQPGGRGLYHFKITKLKARRVPITSIGSLRCSCSGSRYSYSHSSQSHTCLVEQHKATISKYRDDMIKLGVVKALLTLEQQSKLGSRKRSVISCAFSSANADPSPYSASAGLRNPYPSSFASAAANPGPTFSAIGAQGQLHSQHAAKKQKTSFDVINLLDDDDDIHVEEVLGADQAIAKRIKEAEDKGEVVDIS
eukprot:CAMPEP_0172302644 /NCGR_PEP_ID=MMETSP1058-20130122/4309_1 /TAXON_ID=83371 /ORGANISM="Detonula confervacea, Strain CCMP 353" /LENGTH=407 /DNA_ID=CAMNT_0013013193 /DNA_START=166 /DNA_END=1389 /DNA_ORIENTATION=-